MLARQKASSADLSFRWRSGDGGGAAVCSIPHQPRPHLRIERGRCAPLDDTNVGHLCHLIEEIADEVGTRFLFITRHRLTMACIDQLFGVTMEERGVSRLVSVAIRQADLFRNPPSAFRRAE